MNTMNHTAPRATDRPQATAISRQSLLLTICLIAVGLLMAGNVFAKSYTFTWSANPEPVEGYKLYYKKGGTTAPPFDSTGAVEGASPIKVGKVTSYTVTGLEDNATYHFALTAYNGSEESGYSEIVTVNPTAASSSTTAPAPQLLQIKVK